MTVLIIGGGIVGLATARDLSLRGIDVKLVDRKELGAETSSHFHGEVHSGARYAVKEPEAAKRCIEENEILRDIASDYIEDKGGLFLKLDEDTEEYFQKKKNMCEECGIDIEIVDGEELREEIPALSENVDKGIRAPDGVFKPIEFMKALKKDAQNHGADFITRNSVEDIEVENQTVKSVKTEKGTYEPDLVVNATGPWAEKVGDLAGIDIQMKPTKGVMTVVDDPGIDTVINRCAPVDDGDIVIPKENHVIIGTTSIEVEDPDDFPKNMQEENLMVERSSKLVPGIKESENVESYWGLRPLYDPSEGHHGRDAKRAFSVLDHEERDDLNGMITVVGGKWTTHRFMAEKAGDLVCSKLGIEEECVTSENELPSISEIGEVDENWPPTEN